MCMICVEYMNKRMSFGEVKSALKEMIAEADNAEDKAHYEELANMDEATLKRKVAEAD